MKPVIGITTSHNTADERFLISRAYVNAIIDNGGVPILLPPIQKDDMSNLLTIIDGLVLSGGGDINPLLLNEEPNPNIGEISTLRDIFEIELTKKAMKLNIPILGICRGMQIMAIADSGKVIQDIGSFQKDFICHSQKAPRHEETHMISVKKESFLYSITKGDTPVNSFHHQAVLDCGKGFKPTAWSSDGIIEAMESTEGFFIGVQWHPENLYKTNPAQKKLFSQFVSKVKEYKN